MTVSTYKTQNERINNAENGMSKNARERSARQSSSAFQAGKSSNSSDMTQINDHVRTSLFAKKVKRKELVPFVTELSVMLESGVVLSEALDIISEQMEIGTFKTVLLDISQLVKAGESFSGALARYPKIFDPMFISMVKASEASGTMTKMLTILGDYLNFEIETREKVKGALTYPCIMAIVAVAASASLMFFVLPRFTKIYETKGVALPKLTQILVRISEMLCDPQSLAFIITFIVAVIFGLFCFCSTRKGIRTIDYAKTNMPILGTMFIDMVLTRSMRIIATMVNTGVNILDTLDVVRGSCQNIYFTELWENVELRIKDGYQLSEALKSAPNSNLIAPSILQMIRAGEKSGKIGFVCDKISVYYGNKLNLSIKNVTTLIEPLMIIILGSIIGTIAIALLLPVFKISTVISH